jgi:hypothetical protein
MRGGLRRTTVPSLAGSWSGQRAFRRARVNRDALLLGELDRLRVQHLRARLGHFLRLFVGQRADARGGGHHARIG